MTTKWGPKFNLFFTGIPNKQDRFGLSKAEVGRELRSWIEELPEGGKVEVVRVKVMP